MTATKSLPARVYRFVADTVEPAIPRSLRTPAHYFARRFTGRLEAEFDEAMSFARPGTTAVDAGANIGVFSYGFAARGASVHAFEPQPDCAAQIRAFDAAGFPGTAGGPTRRGTVTVHAEALGSADETVNLRIPIKRGRMDSESASLAAGSGESVTYPVAVRTLDGYGLENVSIIKIDVEGTELAVIAGARETIGTWAPAILVEIEQRHHAEPIGEVFERLGEMLGPSYAGSFLDVSGCHRPLAEFDLDRDQLSHDDNPLSRAYVRNFFFVSAPPLTRVAG